MVQDIYEVGMYHCIIICIHETRGDINPVGDINPDINILVEKKR